MKKRMAAGAGLLLIFILISGCFNKTPRFSGESIGRWAISFNEKSEYEFNFDKKRFETKQNCEICCSGTIDFWEIKKGRLAGKTSCDKMVVTFKGQANENTCSGEYQIYTLSGDFLRDGLFKGQMK